MQPCDSYSTYELLPASLSSPKAVTGMSDRLDRIDAELRRREVAGADRFARGRACHSPGQEQMQDPVATSTCRYDSGFGRPSRFTSSTATGISSRRRGGAAGDSTDDPVRDLAALDAAYVSNALDNPALYRAMFDTAAELQDPETAARSFQVLLTAAARARATGRFTHTCDPENGGSPVLGQRPGPDHARPHRGPGPEELDVQVCRASVAAGRSTLRPGSTGDTQVRILFTFDLRRQAVAPTTAPHAYHVVDTARTLGSMSPQIAIRLDEDELNTLDVEVNEGRATSRSDAVRRGIAYIQRRQRYSNEEAKLVELARRGVPVYPDLEAFRDLPHPPLD